MIIAREKSKGQCLIWLISEQGTKDKRCTTKGSFIVSQLDILKVNSNAVISKDISVIRIKFKGGLDVCISIKYISTHNTTKDSLFATPDIWCGRWLEERLDRWHESSVNILAPTAATACICIGIFNKHPLYIAAARTTPEDELITFK